MYPQSTFRASIRALKATVFGVALLAGTPVFAQDAPPAGVRPDSAMSNLVRLLVEQGIITADKGEALMRQAQAEAAAAAPAPAQQQANALPPPAAGSIRVPYVPESVRTQIREELRNDVMAQAKAEGWASPGKAAPRWVNDVKIFGDLRVRSQSELYAKNNSNLILDVARFNRNGPYDLLAPSTIVPTINSTEDRYNRVAIRARLGIEARVADRLTFGLMLATGDDASPVSTNTALAGGLRQRDVWLQQAYVRAAVTEGADVWVGRFWTPFTVTDLVFDPDLAFDGIAGAVDFGKLMGRDFELTLRGGAFPLELGDPDYPSTSFDKRSFPERYLFSAQLEGGVALGGVKAKAAVAYHAFTNMQGEVSKPCDIYSNDAIECSSDARRQLFPQKGNTLFFLRRFDTSANPDPTAQREPQYLGLRFDYRLLNVNGSVAVPVGDRVSATLSGDYVRNLAFDVKDICREGVPGQPLNNVSANSQGVCGATNAGRFVGGNEGYSVFLKIGHNEADKAGAWSLFGGYKYLESDAVLDTFADSDFHLGGTNAKGYVVGGSYNLFDKVSVGARWLSANEIVDQPLAIDVLQVDLKAAF